jgi:hypothetical protein
MALRLRTGVVLAVAALLLSTAVLLPGHNYGWPLVSTGRNYTGTLVPDEPWARR